MPSIAVLCIYEIKIKKTELYEHRALVIHVKCSSEILSTFKFEAAMRHGPGGHGPRGVYWKLTKYVPANGKEKF